MEQPKRPKLGQPSDTRDAAAPDPDAFIIVPPVPGMLETRN
jgi:hypothetical protein